MTVGKNQFFHPVCLLPVFFTTHTKHFSLSLLVAKYVAVSPQTVPFSIRTVGYHYNLTQFQLGDGVRYLRLRAQCYKNVATPFQMPVTNSGQLGLPTVVRLAYKL